MDMNTNQRKPSAPRILVANGRVVAHNGRVVSQPVLKSSGSGLKGTSQPCLLSSRNVPNSAKQCTFKCQVCLEKFFGAQDLMRHRFTHHPNSEQTSHQAVHNSVLVKDGEKKEDLQQSDRGIVVKGNVHEYVCEASTKTEKVNRVKKDSQQPPLPLLPSVKNSVKCVTCQCQICHENFSSIEDLTTHQSSQSHQQKSAQATLPTFQHRVLKKVVVREDETQHNSPKSVTFQRQICWENFSSVEGLTTHLSSQSPRQKECQPGEFAHADHNFKAGGETADDLSLPSFSRKHIGETEQENSSLSAEVKIEISETEQENSSLSAEVKIEIGETEQENSLLSAEVKIEIGETEQENSLLSAEVKIEIDIAEEPSQDESWMTTHHTLSNTEISQEFPSSKQNCARSWTSSDQAEAFPVTGTNRSQTISELMQEDASLFSEVKIEIDVAEDPSLENPWTTDQHHVKEVKESTCIYEDSSELSTAGEVKVKSEVKVEADDNTFQVKCEKDQDGTGMQHLDIHGFDARNHQFSMSNSSFAGTSAACNSENSAKETERQSENQAIACTIGDTHTPNVSSSTEEGVSRNLNFAYFCSTSKCDVVCTTQRLHVCTACGEAFAFSSLLSRHKMMACPKPHVCDVCDKAFAQPYFLKQHKLIHSGQKPHVCDVCNKEFTWAASLQSHKVTHTGEKPHMCDICGKAFARVGDLQRHKLIHTGQKPHVCNVCDKAFASSSRLKRHKLIHSGEKSHVCNVCNKAFTRAWNLKTHKLSHKGQVTETSCP